jgi:hypothetical protein
VRRFITILTGLACGLAPALHAGFIIKEGDASWRYYKGTNTPAGAWTNVAYDDSGWLGPAETIFGYGDGDDETELTDMSNQYVSVFIRRTFTVANTAQVTHLTLGVDYDDGMVAYLNGTQIYRSNLPAGAITHSTFANATREASRAEDGIDRTYVTLNPGLLIQGANVLAASGHNNTNTSSDFSLSMELFTNVTLLRGPILSLQRSNRLTVLWRTDVSSDSVVDYGLTTAYEAGTVSNGAAVRQHEVELPALVPGTDYYYRIKTSGVVLSSNLLHSPPAPGQPFRFGVVGDFGTPYNTTRETANRIALQDVDLLLTVGDNVYNYGQPGSYDDNWFTPYTQTISRAPLMPIIGDHDSYTLGGAPFVANLAMPTNGPTNYIERTYSFDYGNAHFVAIENLVYNPEALNTSRWPVIERWLTNNLAQSTQTWKIVTLHIPPFVSNNAHDEDPYTIARLVPIFEQYGVDLVFGGDSHLYERINPRQGVHYFMTGGGGASLYEITERFPYSAAVFTTSDHSFVYADMSGTVCRLRAMSRGGTNVDEFVHDLGHPFVLDGILDSTNWIRVTNGITLAAAIRSNFLYVACQDAGEGSDHFIYLASQLSSAVSSNWNKNTKIMLWNAYLADEEDHGHHGWYGANNQFLTNPFIARSRTYGTRDGDPSTNHLEGTLDIIAQFTTFPARLYAAAAPFTTTNGGVLINAGQAPGSVSGGGNSGSNIESNEFYGFDTRGIALDLPVAVALSNQTIEAGMGASLDGSGSQAPSGYALAHLWQQVSGLTGQLAGATSALATFSVTSQVSASTAATVRLVVNDTRFDATGTVVITVVPMVDGDADGLSDQEEQTGLNNSLTPANPAGHLSNPALADSDSDGLSDGQEAVAGTVPTNAESVFKVADTSTDGAQLSLRWPSVSARTYRVLAATHLIASPPSVLTNVAADPPTNTVVVPQPAGEQGFISVDVQ